jgi:type IV pilus assembly protein PilQ
LAYTNNLELSKLADSTLILKNKLITKIEEIKPTQSATNAKNTNSTNLAGIELAIEKDVNEQILVSVSANDVPIVDILKSIFDKTKVNFMFFSEPKEKTTIAVKNIPLESLLGFLLSTTDYTFKKSEDVFLFGLRSNEKLREIKVVRLKYRSISDVKSVIPADIAKGVKIDEFPELNAFILSGSDPNIKEVEGLITQIDQPVPVIMIELIIVDVNKTRNLNSGIKVGLSDQPVATKGTILPGLDVTISSSTINSFLDLIGLTNLGRVTPNFYVSLSLLESNGLINISSTPKLSTLNSHEATLSIGETNYYLEQQQNVIGTQNPQTVITNQYKPVNADFSITVNPVLSGDDHITLDVSVNQSQFTGRISPNAPPGQSTRDFQSTIRVKNEEMIVLGGLERTEKSETGEGLPFIARIPIINWFFGNKRKVSNKSKLIIFIKPSIIY